MSATHQKRMVFRGRRLVRTGRNHRLRWGFKVGVGLIQFLKYIDHAGKCLPAELLANVFLEATVDQL